MSDLDALQRSIEHPSPPRGRRSSTLLFAALATPPAAWTLQLLIDYGLSSDACALTQGEHGQARQAGFVGETPVLLAVNLVCLALALGAAALSWRAWSVTRGEKGNAAKAASIGEGLARFLALSGLLSAAIFATGILFNTVEPLMVPVCWRWR